MKEGRTKVKHDFFHETLATVGAIHRVKLGLGPKEIATILQVVFEATSGVVTAYFQGLSADPEEAGDMGVLEQRNDRNLIASRSLSIVGTPVAGLTAMQGTIVIPIPGGYDVATDLGYVAAAYLASAVMHGVAVFYQVRKEAPGEREALIMARR